MFMFVAIAYSFVGLWWMILRPLTVHYLVYEAGVWIPSARSMRASLCMLLGAPLFPALDWHTFYEVGIIDVEDVDVFVASVWSPRKHACLITGYEAFRLDYCHVANVCLFIPWFLFENGDCILHVSFSLRCFFGWSASLRLLGSETYTLLYLLHMSHLCSLFHINVLLDCCCLQVLALSEVLSICCFH